MADHVKFELRSDEDRRRLHQRLTAQFRSERLRTLRRAVATMAAVLSVPLWVEVGWPRLLARRAVAVSFALFAVLGAVLVGLAVREYTWYRRGARARGETNGDER
jgi:hypothetical protein